jgi:prophage regulatory protein
MRFISYVELQQAKGIPGSKLTIWRKERAGKFPKRTPFSGVHYAWIEPVIDAYVAALAAGHDEAAATRIAERKRPTLEAEA